MNEHESEQFTTNITTVPPTVLG